MGKWGKIVLLLLVLLAFFLRIRGLFANSFHADEALFASWARHIAVWKDPLLVSQAVDKPPLLFYVQALFYPMQGPVEWAARLPNFIASILLVPLTAVLFWRLYRDKWGLVVTAVVISFSPMAIQFSGSAFTDPLLTFWLVASLTASSRSARAPFVAGVFFGLAVITKYQGWLFLPLIVGIGWLAGYGRRDWQRWLAGLLPVLALLFVWEMARTGTFALWSRQISNYGGLRLAWSWELMLRLEEWYKLGLTIVPLLLVFVLLGVLVWLGVRALWVDDDDGRVDRLLVLFIGGYFFFHWVVAVPVWDRYLLPLLPLIAIIFGRGVMVLREWLMRMSPRATAKYLPALITCALVLALIIPANAGRYGRYPVGGRQPADEGAAKIAAYLQAAPYGTVLYDHWYSWQWRYHLFDKGVYVSWFPHEEALKRELLAFAANEQPRYLALPNRPAALPLKRIAAEAGFELQPVAIEGNITLYQIEAADE